MEPAYHLPSEGITTARVLLLWQRAWYSLILDAGDASLQQISWKQCSLRNARNGDVRPSPSSFKSSFESATGVSDALVVAFLVEF